MALGASRGDVVRMVMAQGSALACAGAAQGLAGSLAATRVLASALFGVGPRDLAVFVAAPAILVAVALLASYLPARRAAKADPLVALRM
jgi:ABC-type antimicrobial peptide transport system permease subunit